MYHRLQHSVGMAAEPHHRRWITPLEDVVDRKHILVNLDCDSIIGARFAESVVAFFGISVVGRKKSVSVMRRGQ